MKRKTMWFYLQELKEDKFMKRFVIYWKDGQMGKWANGHIDEYKAYKNK
jgi:hypothetical protein